MGAADPGFGVYIHWPYCRRICPYCDFNIHPSRDIDDDAWRDGLLSEVAHFARELQGRTVTSIYFGGGTPSLMAPQTAGAVIDAVHRYWTCAEDVEITLETNPTSSERDRLQDFKQAGVNRLSVGIQSLEDDALAFLGREHSAADAMQTLDDAHRMFARVTFDLIYALPGQSAAAWKNDLDRAVQYAGSHLSLYQLTIESGTPFFRTGVEVPDDDTTADMFEITQDVLARAGLPAYEISNHARPGDESRHNLTGWRGGDYVGIGPGAHGRLSLESGFIATHQVHNPDRWAQLVLEQGHGTAKRRHLSTDDRAHELVMMGLRLVEGIDIERFERVVGLAPDDVIDPDALTGMIEGGLMARDAASIRATAAGRQRLNAILTKLLV